MSTRSTTPLSSGATLSTPSSPLSGKPGLAPQNVFKNPRIKTSHVMEYIAAHSSSAVYVYDLAEHIGFGSLTRSWARVRDDTATVLALQTRAGSGLSLIGRLSEGTSQDTVKGAILTAYTTPTGLSVMAESLSYLPPASPTSRLVLQIPTVVATGENLCPCPSLAPLATVFPLLPPNVTVFFSASPQEAVDLSTLAYRITDSHVIHLFDYYSCSREVGHAIDPPVASLVEGLAIPAALSSIGYAPFDYFGDPDAKTVVVLGNSALALAATAITAQTPGLGVVVVRLLRPWHESSFLDILPSGVKHVHVLDDAPNLHTQGTLYIDVFGTLLDSTFPPTISCHRIVPERTQEYLAKPASFSQFISDITLCHAHIPVSYPSTKKLLYLSTANSPLSALPHIIQGTFSRNQTISTRLLTDYDVCSNASPITVDRMILSPVHQEYNPIPIVFPLHANSLGESDFLGVLDHTLLSSHNIFDYAKPGSEVLVVTPWSTTEFSSNIAANVISLAVKRDLRVFLIDAKDIAANLVGASGPTHDAIFTLIVHLAFLRLYLGPTATETLVYKAARFLFEDVIQGIELTKINARAWSGLEEADLFTDGILPAAPIETPLKEYQFNAITVDPREDDSTIGVARLGTWHDAARHILFPSAFALPNTPSTEEDSQNPALRPDITDRTFLVTCTVNRRLTPLDYDRNVFHLEFDTTGTGLKYAIGEALGVHGWNDEQEVLDFCSWYGVDSDRLITIPTPGGEDKMHTRTVFQILQQQIDLFGRPPKSFYSDLSVYTGTLVDKLALQFIGSPEGSATFKKMSENDTVTFAEVLALYPSARPGIEVLCGMIGDIKPRHYSIASAQDAVGDRVDLLVVSVDWLTPSGITRYGHCTRYLASLKAGQNVTVSIKPSVMKLPPSHHQPIIMAGLGTGAAPFRAFLQYRALIAQQGIPVGPMYYYFGSRYSSQEYLYGEEIEAYIQDGTITRAGLAFSRDGKKKVYIQHKMLEDAEALARMLRDDQGVFYLCGPTWPVPDIYKALVGAFVKYKGDDEQFAGQYLEVLKEEERYVLEVY